MSCVRRGVARALVAVAFICVSLLAARPARATELSSYEIAITPGPSQDVAHFVVRFTYLDKYDDGFKFVGEHEPLGLRAYDAGGRPLRSRAIREVSSGEYKIIFAVPPAVKGSSTAVIEFDQALDRDYSWFGSTAKLAWAPTFKILVRAMKVEVGPGLSPEGDAWDCDSTGRCHHARSGTFPVELRLADGLDVQGVVIAALAGVSSAALLAYLLWRHRRRLIQTRGVYPLIAAPAYPTANDPYRAPPPLPDPASMTPMLSDLDRRGLVWKIVATAATFAGVIGILSVTKSSPVSLGVALAVAQVPVCVAILYYLTEGKGASLAPLAAVFAAMAFSAFGLFGALVAGIGAGATVALARVDFSGIQWSGGGSSSCSSSSSCGGGGGGCGGGGGGGGCGG